MATQAERRASTQARVLDATVEALTAVGYAGTSTPEICRRAGVSQGSIFRYWPTKGDLLAAAAEHLLTRVTAAYEQGFAGRQVGVREALDALWAAYRTDDLMAAVELYVAARTDPELAAALRRFEPAHRANLQRIALAVLDPAVTASPSARAVVELALAAVQGVAVGAAVQDDQHVAVLDTLEQIVLSLR